MNRSLVFQIGIIYGIYLLYNLKRVGGYWFIVSQILFLIYASFYGITASGSQRWISLYFINLQVDSHIGPTNSNVPLTFLLFFTKGKILWVAS